MYRLYYVDGGDLKYVQTNMHAMLPNILPVYAYWGVTIPTMSVKTNSHNWLN